MRRTIASALTLLVWPILFWACPAPVSPAAPSGVIPARDAAPVFDASIVSADCVAACDAIDRVGCIAESDCAAVLCKANSDPRFVHYDTGCLIRALVPSDIAVCGVACMLKAPSSLGRPQ